MSPMTARSMTNRLLGVVITLAIANALMAQAAFARHLELPAASAVPAILASAVGHAGTALDPSAAAAHRRQQALAEHRRLEHLELEQPGIRAQPAPAPPAATGSPHSNEDDRAESGEHEALERDH